MRREHRAHARWLTAVGRAGNSADVPIDPLLDVEARLDAAALRPALIDALLALSEAQREVLLLVAWEALRPTEVATVLGLEQVTTRVHLIRARRHVRDHLARAGITKEMVPDAH